MHLVGGAAAAALLLYLPPTAFIAHLPLEGQLFFASFALLGSLFPDIDIKSKGQKVFSLILFPAIGATIIMEKFNLLALFSFLAVFPLLIKHRGITHNPWFIIGMPLLLVYISNLFVPQYQPQMLSASLFFIAGAMSHVVLDFGPVKTFTRDKRGF